MSKGNLLSAAIIATAGFVAHKGAQKIRDLLLFQPSGNVNESFVPKHRILDTFIHEGKIHIRHYFQQDCDHPKSNVLIFCHGRRGNLASYEREVWALLIRLKDYDIVSFDYEGYGLSKGTPDELNVLANGEAVLDYLDGLAIYAAFVAFGFSLGGSVATNMVKAWEDGEREQGESKHIKEALESKRANSTVVEQIKKPMRNMHCRALVLHATFASLKDAALILPSFIVEFYTSNLAIREWVSHIKLTPLLIGHSTQDEYFSKRHAEIIYKSSNAPVKSLYLFKHGHCEMRRQIIEGGFGNEIQTFLSKCSSNEVSI